MESKLEDNIFKTILEEGFYFYQMEEYEKSIKEFKNALLMINEEQVEFNHFYSGYNNINIHFFMHFSIPKHIIYYENKLKTLFKLNIFLYIINSYHNLEQHEAKEEFYAAMLPQLLENLDEEQTTTINYYLIQKQMDFKIKVSEIENNLLNIKAPILALVDKPDLQCELLYDLGIRQYKLNKNEEAEHTWTKGIILSPLCSDNKLKMRYLVNLGTLQCNLNKFQEAENTLLQGLEFLQELPGKAKLPFLYSLVRAQCELKNFTKAENTLIQIQEFLPKFSAIEKLNFLNSLENVKLNLEKYEEAKQIATNSLSFIEELATENIPNILEFKIKHLYHLGKAEQKLKEFQKARIHFNSAKELCVMMYIEPIVEKPLLHKIDKALVDLDKSTFIKK